MTSFDSVFDLIDEFEQQQVESVFHGFDEDDAREREYEMAFHHILQDY